MKQIDNIHVAIMTISVARAPSEIAFDFADLTTIVHGKSMMDYF